jgi:hypothetical protein
MDPAGASPTKLRVGGALSRVTRPDASALRPQRSVTRSATGAVGVEIPGEREGPQVPRARARAVEAHDVPLRHGPGAVQRRDGGRVELGREQRLGQERRRVGARLRLTQGQVLRPQVHRDHAPIAGAGRHQVPRAVHRHELPRGREPWITLPRVGEPHVGEPEERGMVRVRRAQVHVPRYRPSGPRHDRRVPLRREAPLGPLPRDQGGRREEHRTARIDVVREDIAQAPGVRPRRPRPQQDDVVRLELREGRRRGVGPHRQVGGREQSGPRERGLRVQRVRPRPRVHEERGRRRGPDHAQRSDEDAAPQAPGW